MTHCINFSQNDKDCVVLELPPMTSTSYAYENPFGKKEVRAVVIAKGSSSECRGTDSDRSSRFSRSGSDHRSESYDTACSSTDPIQTTISNAEASGNEFERLREAKTTEEINTSEQVPLNQLLERKRIFSRILLGNKST